MQPTSDADHHLTDRALEFRIAIGGAVLAAITLAAVFFPLELVFGLFAVGYVAYKYRYYRKRVGVFTGPNRTTDIDRLELAIGLFAAAIVGAGVATEAVFDDAWELGGFLSLPLVDFTDTDFLMDNPDMVAAWAIVIAPVAALSYLTLQFRHRNLLGLTDERAVLRATLWDAFVRLPMYFLWMVVLTLGPIFEVWNEVAIEVQEAFDLEPELVLGFSLLLGEYLEEAVAVGLAVPAVAVGAFLLVQRSKYENTTIPELFGYRGAFPPGPGTHNLNMSVPIGVWALVAVGAFIGLGSPPVEETAVLAGIAVAVLVGADAFGYTTITVASFVDEFAYEVDAVVHGIIAGIVVVIGGSIATDIGATTATVAYLAVAPGAAFGANYASARYREGRFADYTAAVRQNPQAADESMIDELFAAAKGRDLGLRASALEGLGASFVATNYRSDETMDVFADSLALDEPQTVQASLRGIATILAIDRSASNLDPALSSWIDYHMESANAQTQARAAQASALLECRKLGPGTQLGTADLPRDRIERLETIAGDSTDDIGLVSAVAEYQATLWYHLTRTEGYQRLANHSTAQRLLGNAIWMSAYAHGQAQLAVIYAVTAAPPVADDTRFEMALDHTDNEQDAVRYLSTIIVRSSLHKHAHEVDAEDLAVLLEDHHPGVRREGARALATYVDHAPDATASIADDLVLFLEESGGDIDITTKHVLDALAGIDPGIVADHPTAATTVAGYVKEETAFVAMPAAKALTRLVRADPNAVEEDAVSAAIESGLTHPAEDVRGQCIDAAVAVIEADVEAGRSFRHGLAWNLRDAGPQSAVAAAALAQLIDVEPADGLPLLEHLAAGLKNPTPIDQQAIPFMIRGETVSDVVVDMLATIVPEDPAACEALTEPLVTIASSADSGTIHGLMAIMNVLSKEFPEQLGQGSTVAATALKSGRTETRRNAAQFLANVAAYRPETVQPVLDDLILVTDDESPRVRSPALAALANVCAAMPRAIEDDIHRVVGLIDDDSAIVRKRAAHLIVTIAEREPGIVQPAAETADRLRRLQRDPAVDYDPEKLQDASAAIQTDQIGEADTEVSEAESLYSPETSDEMGASGETEIFQPVGDDFDMDFDEEFDDEAIDEEEDDDVAVEPTTVEAAEPERDETADPANAETALEEGTDSPADDDSVAAETVIQDEETTDPALDDQDTVIEPDDDAVDAAETVIEPDDDTVDDQDTVIESSGTGVDDEDTIIEKDASDVDAQETVIEPDGTSDPDDQETVIQSDDEADVGDDATIIQEPDDDLDTADTVISPSDEQDEESTANDDLNHSETIIQSDDETVPEEDLDSQETVIEPNDDDVDSQDTVIEPNDDDVDSQDTVIESDGSDEETNE